MPKRHGLFGRGGFGPMGIYCRSSWLRCARIMRLAVHPAVQGRGLGTALMAALVARLSADRLDYLGSSFGATRELLRFWERLAFLPVRLSVKRSATSGAHSALVLRALSPAGVRLTQRARARFLSHFPHQLSDPFRDLEPALAALLLRHADTVSPLPLDAQDWQEVVAFAFGRRIYEMCLAPIWKLACAALAHPATAALLQAADREVLIIKVLQKRSWQATAAALGLSGRAQGVECLRRALRLLIMHVGDASVRREAEQLSAEVGFSIEGRE
jgi:tRNA(Met) cytidine acetyltransferase